jgi:hypothetical protein
MEFLRNKPTYFLNAAVAKLVASKIEGWGELLLDGHFPDPFCDVDVKAQLLFAPF